VNTPAALNKSIKELRARLDYANNAWIAESYEQQLQFFVSVVPKLLDAERCSLFVVEPETGQIRSMFGTLIENCAHRGAVAGNCRRHRDFERHGDHRK